MTTAVSLDNLGRDLPAPATDAPQTLTRTPWRAIARNLADPTWVPGWQAVPVWALDPADIADAITEHDGSDVLTAAQTADLVGRVARRNMLESDRLLSRMRVGGLDDLVGAWTTVLERWATAGSDRATDLTAGPVAVAIADYLTVAARLGLTVAQAAAFASCPDGQLHQAVAAPGAVTRAHVAMVAHPTATYAQVAKLAGISDAYCRMIVSRYGDPCRAQRMRDDRPERIRALAAEGLSYRAIAQAVGCSLGYVAKVMKP